MNDLRRKKMKVVIVGSNKHPIYAPAFVNAMEKIETIDVIPFYWSFYYENSKAPNIIKRLENKYSFGHIAKKINKSLIEFCANHKPDLVFIYTSRMILSSTVVEIKKLSCKVFTYCNDDPFSPYFQKQFWRNYKDCLRESDINYVYRLKNIQDVENYCGKTPKLLRSYYLDEYNFPCKDEELIPETPDVIFLGHYEKDEREEYISSLDEIGISVGLPRKDYSEFALGKKNIILLDNERVNYNRYICSCKIPLVFLSKINHDTYTRRCFEIPAAGAFLFCPFNDDLATMFEEDKEIVFYRNKNDFVEKVKYYLSHDEQRKENARQGLKRLHKDGHEAIDRANQIINDYMTIENQR